MVFDGRRNDRRRPPLGRQGRSQLADTAQEALALSSSSAVRTSLFSSVFSSASARACANSPATSASLYCASECQSSQPRLDAVQPAGVELQRVR
jgi:hypothetical protein